MRKDFEKKFTAFRDALSYRREGISMDTYLAGMWTRLQRLADAKVPLLTSLPDLTALIILHNANLEESDLRQILGTVTELNPNQVERKMRRMFPEQIEKLSVKPGRKPQAFLAHDNSDSDTADPGSSVSEARATSKSSRPRSSGGDSSGEEVELPEDDREAFFAKFKIKKHSDGKYSFSNRPGSSKKQSCFFCKEEGHQKKKQIPKRDPREPKERRGQSVAALLGRSGGPKELPRDSQERPRETQKSPRTLSRPSSCRKP